MLTFESTVLNNIKVELHTCVRCVFVNGESANDVRSWVWICTG